MKLILMAVTALGIGLLMAWRGADFESSRVAAEHADLLKRVAPIAAVAWLTATALGAASRSRVRDGTGHASPTAAWIAKRSALASLVTAALFALSPVAWPAWALYAGLALGAAAWGIYLSNLPLKL